MTGLIYKVTPKDGATKYSDFSDLLIKSGLMEKFNFAEIPLPVHTFKDEFLEYISEHGLSSLYNSTIIMEDITSTSMAINDLEKVAHKFIAQLDGSKQVLIIDPYFYAKGKKFDAATMFAKLLKSFSSQLEEIVIVSNGFNNDTKTAIHAAIGAASRSVRIQDIISDEFHDRFWIGVDTAVGVVVGTSFGSLGNKVALIDKLKQDDVNEVIAEARNAGVPV